MFERQDIIDSDEPVFVISVAARMVGVRTQTLRYYERLGLVTAGQNAGQPARVLEARRRAGAATSGA